VTRPPDEPPIGGSDQDDPDHSAEESDGILRGWIDPDDRLWRHPSELGGTAGLRQLTQDHRVRHARLMLLTGVVAVAAVVAWASILLSPASDHPTSAAGLDSASDSPLTTLAATASGMPGAASAAGQSLVALRAVTSHGEVTLVGVAVADGGLVATTAAGLAGLRRLDMVGPDGHLLSASVVGVDSASNLALINVPDDLPVAPFADDASLASGTEDYTLSMDWGSSDTVSLRCTPGLVTSVGSPITSGPANGMPDITSTAPGLEAQAGDPLLNEAGQVVGLLNAPSAGSSAPAFLPTQLVLAVADDLRSTDKVEHGWLGVDGTDMPGVVGAKVAAVMPGSPAFGRLQAGEVIVGIGSVPIRTMAELKARLYVMAPGSPVDFSVRQGGSTQVVDVTLGASP
jgi:S1-C subfamily serine protease